MQFRSIDKQTTTIDAVQFYTKDVKTLLCGIFDIFTDNINIIDPGGTVLNFGDEFLYDSYEIDLDKKYRSLLELEKLNININCDTTLGELCPNVIELLIDAEIEIKPNILKSAIKRGNHGLLKLLPLDQCRKLMIYAYKFSNITLMRKLSDLGLYEGKYKTK